MRAAFIAAALAAFVAAPAQQQQVPPVFRGGVDLVTVDAVVLDRNGRQITDLTREDFTVVADRKPRRIVSADYIATHPSKTAAPAAPVVAAPGPTSNHRLSPTRTIIFVADTEEIRTGEGRETFKEATDFVDRLGPDDRVGFVSLPTGVPRIDPTTNRQAVHEAMQMVVGTQSRYKGLDMTPGEAGSVAHADVSALNAYIERVRGRVILDADCHRGRPTTEPRLSVSQECRHEGERMMEEYLHHTRDMMDMLRALAVAMAPIEGPKAIVMISEGLSTDPTTIDSLRRFATALEQSRVSLYALHLEAPLSEAEMLGGSTIKSRALDERAGLAGMDEMASWARGTAIRVPGSAKAALDQIDAEMSGYYLLSFEREPSDKDGASAGIQVKVNRDGVVVRSRREFTPGPLPAGAAGSTKAAPSLKDTMTTLLNWPGAISDVDVDVDTFVTPVPGSAKDTRLLVVAELGRTASAVKAVGYAIANETGKVVADQLDTPPTLQPLPRDRSLYAFALSLPPGKYRLKLGTIDAEGHRGSVDHLFEISPWPAGAVRVSDLMLSDEPSGMTRPSARIASDAESLSARLEVHADTPAAFDGITIKLQIQRVGETTLLGALPLALAETQQPQRRVAAATLNIASLAPGNYVVTVIVQGAAGEIARRARAFSR